MGRLGKEAGARALPCVSIIGTRLPVEYMANGMAFWPLKGLVGDGDWVVGVISATPTALMRPPSAEKMRLTSNPGVFVGMPLKSRQEIWSRVTEVCETGLGAGGGAWFVFTPASDAAEKAWGSCLGEMASESR
jgi:hypothetical protein